MTDQRSIRDLLLKIVGLDGKTIPTVVVSTVTSVDKDYNTCTVIDDSNVSYVLELVLNSGDGAPLFPSFGATAIFLDFGNADTFLLGCSDYEIVRFDIPILGQFPATFSNTVQQGDGNLKGVPISGNIADQMNIIINAITLISTQLKLLGQPGVPQLSQVSISTFANNDFTQGAKINKK